MDKKRFFHFITTSFLLCALLSCAGSRTKITDIQNDLSQYNEKRVKVAGKVTQTFAIPVLGQSFVRVDDGTGTIWVKPKGRVPFEGDKIKVEGTVKVALTIGTKNFGVIVIEDDKK